MSIPSYLDPSRVLVCYKTNSTNGASLNLAAYYLQMRGVPTANLLGLTTTPAAGTFYSSAEYSKFVDEMMAPINAKLQTLGPTNIDTILLCGDLPTVVCNPWIALSLDSVLCGVALWPPTDNVFMNQTANPYFDPSPTFVTPGLGLTWEPMPHFSHSIPRCEQLYMVCRLGSDNPARGINQIDQALYAEKYLAPCTYGMSYVNTILGTQNTGPNVGQLYTLPYLAADFDVIGGNYQTTSGADENIAYSMQFLETAGFPYKWLPYGEIGAEGSIPFTDGTSSATAPEALFYCGWYNYNIYRPVFDWMPGSISDDVNSVNTFGLGALKDGATCALYVTGGEPQVPGNPRPNIWLYYLLQGYSFAEAAMLCQASYGWMGVAEGDPLYCPMQEKTVVPDASVPVFNHSDVKLDANLGWIITTPVANPSPKVCKAKVDYGPTPSYGHTALSIGGYTKAPVVPMDWVSMGIVHYRVTLTDPFGNSAVGPDAVHILPPGPPPVGPIPRR